MNLPPAAPSRRTFLKKGLAAAAGGVFFPSIVPSHVLGVQAPSNQITLGFIGVGSHGIHMNLKSFLHQEDAKVLAVCDVYEAQRIAAKKLVDDHYGNQDCSCVADFWDVLDRKDIGAICVSTPDHWHVPLSLYALRMGKDVICEKPTFNIEEGRLLADEVNRRGAVFQTSTEDRSIQTYHRMAELVRNERIGTLQRILVGLPSGRPFPNEGQIPVPAGLDYDRWLGPAPFAPYTENRCERMHWRQIFDYSGGIFSDWGAHLLDTAQWANDTERTGPIHVEGHGTFMEDSLYNTPVEYELRYLYQNGVEMQVRSGGVFIRFEGTEGWVGNQGWRGPFQASSKAIRDAVIEPGETHLFTCPQGEHRNFLDCVKSRDDPYFPAEIGHRCSTVMHIGNIAMLLGRKLRWDPQRERFRRDDAANAMRSRTPREPWTL